MTAAEYQKLYNQASNQVPFLSLKAINKMKEIYEQAAAEVAKVVEDGILKNVSELTTESLRAIQNQLEQGAVLIEKALNEAIPISVQLAQKEFNTLQEEYLFNIVSISGGKITEEGIKAMLFAINDRVNMSIIARIYQDGYTYSQRVWNAAADFQETIKDIISAGLAQGRDLIDIAKDINIYVKTDKQTLIKRYGDLLKGTKEFTKRIRKQIYYPSLRLVRSELYASMMDYAKLIGQYNPGCNGLYDWLRGGLTDWNCSCPEYAANSPYMLEKLPGYPHPNCLCRIRPRLRNQNDFIKDIKAWGQGAQVDYIDNWYTYKYPRIAGGIAA